MAKRSYSSAVRAAEANRRRGDVVRAARAILCAGDPGAFSLDAAAKGARVTRMTVYNQFGSRSGLLESVFDAAAEQGGLERIKAVMTAPTFEESVVRLIDVFCSFWASDPVIGEIHRMAAVDAELAAALDRRNARRRMIIETLLTRHAAADDGLDARELGAVLYMLTAFATWESLMKSLEDGDLVSSALKTVALSIMRPAPHGARR